MLDGWLREQIGAAGLSHLSSDELVATLSDAQVDGLMKLWEAEVHEQRYCKFENLFPTEYKKVGAGEWSEYFARDLYPRHMEHFAAGAKYTERCFMAGNRVGKTVVGAFEATCHATGQYPDWWPGYRFRHPIRAWAAGDTNETTRDIIQKLLLGDIAYRGARKTVDGTGIIPTGLIGRGNGQLSWKQGATDLIDQVKIKHVSGGWSTLGLKSYKQGRKAFQGTSQHFVWVDEEPEEDVYAEARMRTMTCGGLSILTYTPLEGLTDTVLSFLPQAMKPLEDEPLDAGNWGNW